MQDYKDHLNQVLKKHSENKYIASLNILIGKGIHKEIINKIKEKNLGKRVLLCTGSRAMRNHGFLDLYINELKNAGFEVKHYVGLQQIQ